MSRALSGPVGIMTWVLLTAGGNVGSAGSPPPAGSLRSPAPVARASASPHPPGPYRSYHQAPLADVLMELARAARQDIVIGDRVRGLVTLRTWGEPPAQLLADLARAHGCRIERFTHLAVVLPARLAPSVRPEDLGGLEARFHAHRISLRLSGVPLARLLDLLGQEASLTLIARPPAGARIWAQVTSRPLPELLAAIAMTSELSCQVRPSSVAFFAPGHP